MRTPRLSEAFASLRDGSIRCDHYRLSPRRFQFPRVEPLDLRLAADHVERYAPALLIWVDSIGNADQAALGEQFDGRAVDPDLQQHPVCRRRSLCCVPGRKRRMKVEPGFRPINKDLSFLRVV